MRFGDGVRSIDGPFFASITLRQTSTSSKWPLTDLTTLTSADNGLTVSGHVGSLCSNGSASPQHDPAFHSITLGVAALAWHRPG